jgi:hypothetical protein
MKYFSSIGLLGLLAVGGCMSESAPDTKTPTNFSVTDAPSYDFALSPAELTEKVKQMLATMGIEIASQQGSVLITAYKDYPGSFHIVRRWPEHTRYRITIFPDSYEPTRRSHLEITSQTQTRATSQEPWHSWAEYQRPQRAAALAKMLHEQIQGDANPPAPVMSEQSQPAPTPTPTPALTPAAVPADAEAVLITYHVIPGKEAELQHELSDAWKLYQKENLVVAEPHVIVRDKDADGKTCFVESFSWISHKAPEQVSESVRAVWDQMQTCCEERGGRPGIDGHEVMSVELSQP